MGQLSIDEIRNHASSWNTWFEGTHEREYRNQLASEQILERLIGQLEGVKSSLVAINRPKAPAWGRPVAKASAFVYIETEGNRRLPYQTIQAIPNFVSRYESSVTPASITVVDRNGTIYFDAGNMAVGDQSRNRAREEELAKDIQDALDWIKGVRVQVQVTSPRTVDSVQPLPKSASAQAQSAAPKQRTAPTGIAARSASDLKPRETAVASQSTMRVNQPLTLERNHESVSHPVAARAELPS